MRAIARAPNGQPSEHHARVCLDGLHGDHRLRLSPNTLGTFLVFTPAKINPKMAQSEGRDGKATLNGLRSQASHIPCFPFFRCVDSGQSRSQS